MEKKLAVVRFDELPSPKDFSSQIESRNVPAVFHGCIKDWKAFSMWNPCNGGLDYLQVPLPFSTFITSCKHLQTDDGHGVSASSKGIRLTEPTGDETSLASASSSHQVYLAQVPISNLEDNERSQLESLREDIQMVVTPKEKTKIAEFLSSVDVENPDFSTHSRAKSSMGHSQNVILQVGDALFIPEGWYHQVDSDDLTIAVNFWWQSSIMSSMSQHMDAYYIHRITRRLLDVEMVYLYFESKYCEACLCIQIGQDQMLHRTSADNKKSREDKSGKLTIGESGHFKHDIDEQRKDDDLEGTRNRHRIMLQQLDSLSLQSLVELISLVHDGVSTAGQSEQVQSTLLGPRTLNLKGECEKIAKPSSFNLEDDPVAKTLWTLEPLKLQKVLLAMVHNFPRTVESLVLHMLSPLAAEVLTQKFEEMDQQTSKEDRNEFYLVFYGVFDDQSAAMDAILNGKETFARQAFHNVLDKYLGVNVDR